METFHQSTKRKVATNWLDGFFVKKICWCLPFMF
jgi:hypothetical protein